jgi:ubiquinone/menaquinone biosynthesis C-methylase UbiE
VTNRRHLPPGLPANQLITSSSPRGDRGGELAQPRGLRVEADRGGLPSPHIQAGAKLTVPERRGTIGRMTDDAAGRADEQWQLEGDAAELYQRHLVPAITAGWAASLVERAGLRRGERVLDVACGTGVVARAAARRVGRAGHVAGIDMNAGMLAVARSLPTGPGAGIGWSQGSALNLPFAAGSCDVVLCQLGLQFFPDRPAALAEMRRVLVTGGRLGLSVYGPIEHNPAAFALARALDRHLGPDASVTKRAEHALADPALWRMLAAEAGFSRVRIVTETRIVRFASVSDYVRIQLTATPLASLLRHQAEGSIRHLTAALITDVAATLHARRTQSGLAFPQEAHILMASM